MDLLKLRLLPKSLLYCYIKLVIPWTKIVRVILEKSIFENTSCPVTRYERNFYTFFLERLEINSAVWSVRISKLWLLIILPSSVGSSSRLSACVWCISVSFLKYQHFIKLWKWRTVLRYQILLKRLKRRNVQRDNGLFLASILA